MSELREIIIIREKRVVSSLEMAAVVLDGVVAANVKNGETVRLTVDKGEHQIFAHFNKGVDDVVCIKAGNEDIVLNLTLKSMGARVGLVPQNESQGTGGECNVTVVKPQYEPKSKVPSIVCGIIIALILAGFSLFIFSIQETSVVGFILGVVLAAASGTVMILGGFWFIVIPLPYIFLWRGGCNKPNQSTGRKILLGILAVVLPILVFVALFALRNI